MEATLVPCTRLGLPAHSSTLFRVDVSQLWALGSGRLAPALRVMTFGLQATRAGSVALRAGSSNSVYPSCEACDRWTSSHRVGMKRESGIFEREKRWRRIDRMTCM